MKVLKIKEYKDGSATISFTIDEAERKLIKQVTGVKRLTKKRIGEFVLDSLIERAKEVTKN